MKIYKATIIASNSCYLETVLVVAEDKEKAHDQLCKHEKRKVQYTQKLEELDIDLEKSTVIGMVGWGHSENDYGSDD